MSLPLDYLNDLDKLRDYIIDRALKGEDQDKLLDLTIQTLSNQVINSFNPAGDFETQDAAMLTRLVKDTWSFSAAKNYQQTRDLTLALRDEKGNLREFSDFKEQANSIVDKYNDTWLRTEYDFAIAASQSAARWNDFEKEADIIPNIRYQTVGDDNVRASHQVLDGIIKPLSDPFWTTHYPPNGWGCRCEAVQSLSGSKITDDNNIPHVEIPKIFETNLAKTGLIYPKHHPYYNGVPRAEINKALAHLPPKNTFISKVIDGVKLDIHPLHGEKELAENIEISKLLKKFDKEAKIKLMPILEKEMVEARKLYYPKDYLQNYINKNADAIYNNRLVEYETASNSKSSVQNAIKNGKKQADFVVVRLSDEMSMQIADNIVKGQIKHYQDKENLTIWVVNKTELKEYIIKQKQQ